MLATQAAAEEEQQQQRAAPPPAAASLSAPAPATVEEKKKKKKERWSEERKEEAARLRKEKKTTTAKNDDDEKEQPLAPPPPPAAPSSSSSSHSASGLWGWTKEFFSFRPGSAARAEGASSRREEGGEEGGTTTTSSKTKTKKNGEASLSSSSSASTPSLLADDDDDDAPPPGFGAPLREPQQASSSNVVPFERRGKQQKQTQTQKQSLSSTSTPRPPSNRTNRETTPLSSSSSSSRFATPSSRQGQRQQQQRQQQQQRALFAPHWEPSAVDEAVRAGRAFKGTIRFAAASSSSSSSSSTNNVADASSSSSCAYLSIPGLPVDAMVRGATAQNRSIDGDEVAVVLRPPNAWWEVRSGGGGSGSGSGGGSGSSSSSWRRSMTPTREVPSPATPSAAGLDAQLAAKEAALGRALAEAGVRGSKTSTSGGNGGGGGGGGGDGDDTSSSSPAPAPAPPSAAQRALAATARLLEERPDLRPTAAVVAVSKPSRRRARFSATVVVVGGGGGGGSGNSGDVSSSSSSSPSPPRQRFFFLEPVDARMPRVVAVPKGEGQEAASATRELFELMSREERGEAEAEAEAETEEGNDASSLSSSSTTTTTTASQKNKPAFFRKTLLLAEITGWPNDSPFPIARVTAALGKRGDLAAETAALLAAEAVDASDFPPEALDELPGPKGGGPESSSPSSSASAPSSSASASPWCWEIPREEFARRRDLRFSRKIFSIDPATARDLDDALSLETVEEAVAADEREREERERKKKSDGGGGVDVDGGGGDDDDNTFSSSSLPPLPPPPPPPPPPSARWRLGVHIADVSAFVKPGTALDAAAKARATSVYLVSSVVPMLPRRLCEQLCSLGPGEDRLAFSVDFWLDGQGRPVGVDDDDGQGGEESAGGGGGGGGSNDDDDDGGEDDDDKAAAPASTSSPPFVVPATFYRSVIRSCAKLAYSDAQAMIEAVEMRMLTEGGGGGGGSGSGRESDDNDDDDDDDATSIATAAAAGRAAFELRREHAPPESRPPPLPSVPWEALALGVRRMWRLALARREERFRGGALRLDNTKLCFELSTAAAAAAVPSSAEGEEEETGVVVGEPVDATPYVQREANALVEEFMLLANRAAASRIARWLPSRALLRSHPPPQARKLAELACVVEERCGMRLDVSSAGALQASLAALRSAAAASASAAEAASAASASASASAPSAPSAPSASAASAAAALEAAKVEVVTLMLTKPMKVASYVCAGAIGGGSAAEIRGGRKDEKDDDDGDGDGDGDDDETETDAAVDAASVRASLAAGSARHYALAVDLYTHFTSPIRRYPDVVVHRLLEASLELEREQQQQKRKRKQEQKEQLEVEEEEPPASWFAARGIASPRETALVAQHCNDRKAAAKAVQDASSRLYLTALLASRPTALEAFATGVGGPRFLDCYVPALGVEVRVTLEEVGGGGGGGGGVGGSGGSGGGGVGGGGRGFAGGGRGSWRRRTSSNDDDDGNGGSNGSATLQQQQQRVPSPPPCPAHGHLSKKWCPDKKSLTLSLRRLGDSVSSPSPPSPSSSSSPSCSDSFSASRRHLLPLDKPLHNPGAIEPARLPLEVSHLSRVPLVVGARTTTMMVGGGGGGGGGGSGGAAAAAAAAGGAPELAAWLLVEGGAWAVRVAEVSSAQASSVSSSFASAAGAKKGGARSSFVDDLAD